MKSRIITTFLIICVFLQLYSFSSKANPLPVDVHYEGNLFPMEETPVYLKSERIEVTFDEKAHVKATYIFANDEDNVTHVSILLPFNEKPSTVEVIHNNETIPHGWSKTPAWIEDYSLHSGIIFNLSFGPKESKTVLVQYKRNYRISDQWEDNEIYYQFKYIFSTIRYWDHNVESAEFIFRIPNERCDDINDIWFMEDATYKHENDYYVIEKKFENISHANYSDDIYISWNQDFPWYKKTIRGSFCRLPISILVITIVIIITCVIVIIYKKKKKKKLKIIEEKK